MVYCIVKLTYPQTSVKNAEAITQTPGVTSLVLDPADLRVSLGSLSKRIGLNEAPELMSGVQTLIDMSEKHCIPLTAPSFNASAADTWTSTCRTLLTGVDLYIFVKCDREVLDNMQQLVNELGYTVAQRWI